MIGISDILNRIFLGSVSVEDVSVENTLYPLANSNTYRSTIQRSILIECTSDKSFGRNLIVVI